ncbi:HepT-like ribonuclease domain-containing protein [Methanocorpusculum petauri]|uniref:HepT-like ribonuclease domain-containing protein n=1 Tax=Methanocorpusculum petauri TaxID=3002863 RepID=UPI003CCBC762
MQLSEVLKSWGKHPGIFHLTGSVRIRKFHGKKITDTRNRLIHGYFNVSLLLVWEMLQTDVPRLSRQLTSISIDSDLRE